MKNRVADFTLRSIVNYFLMPIVQTHYPNKCELLWGSFSLELIFHKDILLRYLGYDSDTIEHFLATIALTKSP